MGDTVSMIYKKIEDADEMDRWKRSCELIGTEVGERILIWVRELRDNFKASAGNPNRKLT